MKNKTLYELEEVGKNPQWVINRLSYREDKNIIDALIRENIGWIEFYKKKQQVQNCIFHQEKIFYLENLLLELEVGLKIPDDNKT